MSAKLRDAPIEEPQLLGDGRKRYMVHGSSFEVPIHYNVLKAVGYGAYGLVCSALNTETNEKVAIKKMPKVFDDLVDGKRILREIKILTYLNHENIIGIKDVFRPRNKQFDDIYYVADLMESDLHQIIRSKQKLSDEHYQYFIYQVLRALKYIHSGEILHRDLKPGNLLVNGNCDLRVCDFGLARGFDPNELTDYVVTRWYRPPELLLMAVEYGPAVDVWSAGCIFAELMNRKPLFPGRDYINQLNLITDVLGVPTEEDVQTIKSQEAVRYLKSMSKKTPVAMAELFPSCTNRLAIDFLDSMLTFNPAKRVTAAQALSHPYLAQLHDPADEPNCPNVFSWKYDSQELKENELRSLFWEEIVKFHPDDEKK